ncbi:MAG: 1,4-alpha-glucan branching enzyme, partial [Caulobacterales bacterium]|nr:1,4-alpha-glucan branching enzyme [Caulobacterales bacterium]
MSAAYDYDDEREQIDAFLRGRMEDPAAFLGLRMNEMGDGLRARVYAPGAQAVEVVDAADHERAWPLRNVHEEGVFAGPITGRRRRFDYRLRITRDGATADTLDPYGAPDLVSQDDILRFRQGRLWRAYEVLGAHPRRIGDVEGYAFTVWAPRARRVSVVGDFNDWDGRRHPMRRRAEAGLWELFLPELDTGAFYKFEIVDADGTVGEMKSDPAAFHAELRPDTASRLAGPISGDWSDPWTDGRAERNAVDAPISIYELHPGSWRRVPEEGDRPLTYAELGDYLIPYVTEMGFTHVQFLPITEHPFDGSWGYQPTGLFAPTSRFGTPEELRALVARLHEAGVGVLLDFVPAHFPTDAHGLGRFDGAPLYEHEDPQRGFHPDWGTYIYDYGKPEVRNFLISAALYWLDAFHLDGLRIDAVSSMLYLDYSRKEGEWSPNIYGGNINLEAADFVRLMNEMAYGENDGV